MLQIITQIHTRKNGTNPAKFPRSPDIWRVFEKILCSNHSCSFLHSCIYHWVASPTDGSVGKESAYKLVDVGSSLRLERSPGEGNDNPLQDSCLTEEPDRLQSMGSQRVRHDWVSANTRLPLNLRDYPSQVLQCNGLTPLDWSPMSQRVRHDLATEQQQPTWHHLRAPHRTSIRFICSKPPVNPMEYSSVGDSLYHIGGP